MICKICGNEMKYFLDRQTCGWKCNSCGNIIVTTYTDEIEFDETIYCISISPVLKPNAIAIKNIAKICNCSFITAKEILTSGGNIGEFNAIKTREILNTLYSLNITYSACPEFMHAIQ